MSKLVHLCTDCRHPKHNHTPRDGAFKPCTCCRREPREITVDPEPTLLATFAFPGGEPEPLHEPGTTRNPDSSAHREKLCDCEACHAAYAREAG